MSRGELVEIGGGVRIPEIVRRAGARLVEVGTTNRTRAEDFGRRSPTVGRGRPPRPPVQLPQAGFVERPDAGRAAELAHAHGALVIDDLGSGALLETAASGWPTSRRRASASPTAPTS